MELRLISIYCNCVRHWLGKLGNAFLWPFSLSIHWCSHLKKQSRDTDVVGRVQNGTCQVTEKMRYVKLSTSKLTTIDG